MKNFKIIKTASYKVGIDEIENLKDIMTDLMKPVLEHLENLQSWGELRAKIEPTEYRSRDGFIPYSSNCGGVEIHTLIPKCGEDDFSFLEFGNCDKCGKEKHPDASREEDDRCGYRGQECGYESEGDLDAGLRIWFKFEGIQDSGALKFYLYAGGGNGDAPYFRSEHETTIFESSFEVKTSNALKAKGRTEIYKLIKKLS